MEKVSAMMDNALTPGEIGQLLRAGRGFDLQDQTGLHASWQSYHLIGEALRGELDRDDCAEGTNGALTARICAAIAAEPSVLVPAVARGVRDKTEAAPEQPSAQSASVGRFLRVGNGESIWRPWLMAASVATAAVVGWQAVTSDWRRVGAPSQMAAQSGAYGVNGANGTNVPSAQIAGAGVNVLRPNVVPSTAAVSYDRYLQAHQEVAPVTRLSSPRVYTQPVGFAVTH